MALANVQDVIVQVLVQRVPGSFGITLDAADSKALPLPQRMEHQALVFADDLVIGGPDFTRLRRQVLAQESSEVTLTDETDTGAVFFVKDIEPGSLSKFTDPRLFKLTHREQRFLQLLVTDRVQEITLVLVVIQAA